MSFNPFRDSWPFGRTSTGYPRSFKDNAEDVPFEEVKYPAKERVIDEHARAAQIADAVLKETEDIMRKSPISGLLVASLFVSRAKWSDDNPVSKFSSDAERTSAMAKEVEQMQNAAEPSVRGDLMFSMILFMAFSKGAKWADQNPAPLK